MAIVALLVLICLTLFLGKELADIGQLKMASVVAYAQIVFWVSAWVLCSLVCRRPGDAQIIMAGFAAGALITAISVLTYFALGSNLTDAYQGIRATSG